MAIDVAKLKAWPFKDIEQRYSARDTILYALGVGLGHDPMDRDALRFVYEDGLQALPTFAVVLGYTIWGDVPNLVAWSGIALLVGSGLYVLHHERRRVRRAAVLDAS